MKSERQQKILELIREYEIETQEELIFYLNKYGFETTQATVSRDIRELKLTKVTNSVGNYKYAVQGTALPGTIRSWSWLPPTGLRKIWRIRSST